MMAPADEPAPLDDTADLGSQAPPSSTEILRSSARAAWAAAAGLAALVRHSFSAAAMPASAASPTSPSSSVKRLDRLLLRWVRAASAFETVFASIVYDMDESLSESDSMRMYSLDGTKPATPEPLPFPSSLLRSPPHRRLRLPLQWQRGPRPQARPNR